MTAQDAVLVLEDGTTFHGTAFGAAGAPRPSFGEMVFNTGMTGYQETLTDPSYHRQIVAMTSPHIGNTGINDEDHESRRIWVAGYVVREPARIASSWRAIRGLDDELRARGVTGIAIVGTRALTRHLRDAGAMRAAISAAPAHVESPAALLEEVLASPSMAGADLAREVSTPEPYVVAPPAGTATRYRVAAVDLGIKAMTPRKMAERGCEVHVLPATVTAADIMDTQPDGVFFSNGPGDPAAAGYAVEAMRGVLDERIPLFGICLGSQILGRALGLRTYKLLFGHRGVNQPVADLATGRVHITSHNHGFAVAPPGFGEAGGTASAGAPRMTKVTCDCAASHRSDVTRAAQEAGSADRLAGSAAAGAAAFAQPFGTGFGRAEVSHVCLNDGVVEGLRLLDRPAFGVQYHPEAAPGPHDAAGLFGLFAGLMDGDR